MMWVTGSLSQCFKNRRGSRLWAWKRGRLFTNRQWTLIIIFINVFFVCARVNRSYNNYYVVLQCAYGQMGAPPTVGSRAPPISSRTHTAPTWPRSLTLPNVCSYYCRFRLESVAFLGNRQWHGVGKGDYRMIIFFNRLYLFLALVQMFEIKVIPGNNHRRSINRLSHFYKTEKWTVRYNARYRTEPSPPPTLRQMDRTRRRKKIVRKNPGRRFPGFTERLVKELNIFIFYFFFLNSLNNCSVACKFTS